MVLAQKQTYKPMEQDRKPGGGGELCQSYTKKQVEQYNGGKSLFKVQCLEYRTATCKN